MSTLRLALALSAATALLAGAAAAQPAYDNSQSAPPPAPMASDPNAAPPPAAPMTDTTAPMAATSAGSNVSATLADGTQVIASPPVPDTRANRARFGGPMSRAGKRTAPAGN
jgi:hypothetical protein